MKAREYIEQKFIPWILFLDSKDTIKHFEDGKEEYLCELYNHISVEFKSIIRYELYMFRVTTQKIMLPTGISNVIISKLPEINLPGESIYLILIHSSDQIAYYTVSSLMGDDYQLTEFKNGQKKNITIIDSNIDSIMTAIKTHLLL